MGLETRKGGGAYYYRKRRIDGRVVSEYVGSGDFAGPLAEKTGLLQSFAQANNIKIIDWASIGGQYPLSGGVHPDNNYDKMVTLVLDALGSPGVTATGGP